MGDVALTERKKYEAVWSHDTYRHYSPGETMIPLARDFLRKPGTLVDIGCGTGRASLKWSKKHRVTMLDFADNAPEVDLPFINTNIFGKWPKDAWDYGYCCDVLEHLPEDKVEKALINIRRHCNKVFFTIHFDQDQLGSLVGHPLHLTVKPFTWWRDKLKEHFELKDARDLIGMGAFYCV